MTGFWGFWKGLREKWEGEAVRLAVGPRPISFSAEGRGRLYPSLLPEHYIAVSSSKLAISSSSESRGWLKAMLLAEHDIGVSSTLLVISFSQ